MECSALGRVEKAVSGVQKLAFAIFLNFDVPVFHQINF
jgi:hypothetical protein